MGSEVSFILLLAVASGVALVAKRLRLPYTIALVVAGLLLGLSKSFAAPHLTKELLYAVVLPGLIFEAAYHLELKGFLENKLAIVSLAAPGVVAGILASGLILVAFVSAFGLEPNFRFVDALVCGGLLAATDPIAVVALFKSLGAPKRLGVLVEGESLLNDGTAIVIFGIILSMALGGDFEPGHAVVDFVKTVGLGVIVGGAFGYAASKIIQRIDDAMVEMTLTTIAGYGSFVFAEQFHVSGVIATVVAGIVCGNLGAARGMSPSTKLSVATFWEYVSFVLNSIVFLLIGREIDVVALAADWAPIVLAWLAVTAGRAVVVAGASAVLAKTREKIPLRWQAVVTWGGLRGGLSMVLALSLPLEFTHRAFLVNVTFGVVLVSILVQGLTMAPLLRKLGITRASAARDRYESSRATALAARAALAEIGRLEERSTAAPSTLTALRRDYEQRLAGAEATVREIHAGHDDLNLEERRRVERHLLLLEKEQITGEIHAGLLSSDAAHQLLADIDARLLALESAAD